MPIQAYDYALIGIRYALELRWTFQQISNILQCIPIGQMTSYKYLLLVKWPFAHIVAPLRYVIDNFICNILRNFISFPQESTIEIKDLMNSPYTSIKT